MTGPCTSLLCVEGNPQHIRINRISARQTESAWFRSGRALLCVKRVITDGVPERRKVYGKFDMQLPVEAPKALLRRKPWSGANNLSAVPNPALARTQDSGTDGQQNDRHQAQHGQRQCDIG